jgi:hypothetical protein
LEKIKIMRNVFIIIHLKNKNILLPVFNLK